MHEQWEDLIPFYVARTLPLADAKQLETHLAQCEHCRRSLEEWRSLAAETWRESEAWGQGLPPLSRTVRAEIQQDAVRRQAAHAQSNNGTGAATKTQPFPAEYSARKRKQAYGRVNQRFTFTGMAAAAFIVVLFGGLIMFMLRGPGQDDRATVLELTPIGSIGPETLEGSEIAAVSSLEAGAPDIGIITQESVTRQAVPPTMTPVIPPTLTFAGTQSAASQTFETTITEPGLCYVTPISDQAVVIYALPGKGQASVGQLAVGQRLRSHVWSGDGWYEVYVNERLGWVAGGDVTLNGDCGSLPVPSPTQAQYAYTPVAGANGCQASPAGSQPVNLYKWPGTQYTIVATLQPGVLGNSNIVDGSGWHQITIPAGDGLTYVTGWAFGQEIVLRGDCSNLWLPTPTPTQMIPQSQCFATGGMTVYTGPGVVFEELRTLDKDQIPPVIEKSDNGWYHVQRDMDALDGWVDGSEILLQGFCDDLPVLPSSSFTPPEAAAPEIVTFSVDKPTVKPGAQVTVTWATLNAQSVTLTYRDNLNNIIQTLEVNAAGTMVFTAPENVTGVKFGLTLLGAGSVPIGSEISLSVTADNTGVSQGAPFTIASGSWSHITIIQEHGCGGVVGQTNTVNLTITPSPDYSTITLTYSVSDGASFLLNQSPANKKVYSGSYRTQSATIAVTLTFTSDTAYTAIETITHDNGCVVRSNWNGKAA